MSNATQTDPTGLGETDPTMTQAAIMADVLDMSYLAGLAVVEARRCRLPCVDCGQARGNVPGTICGQCDALDLVITSILETLDLEAETAPRRTA